MLLGSLQENLIVLLVYDTQRAPIIRGLIPPELFGGIYRKLSERIYAHIDRFKKPPEDHLPDILGDLLEGKNPREAELYTDVIESIHAAKGAVNAEYVMSQLETFVRRQSLRNIAIDLAKALQRDTEQALDEAEQLIAGATRASLSVFDAGTRLSDAKRALKFLDVAEGAFPTGIPELDRRGFGPTRKEMWALIANTKAGKSWGLIQLAKMALLHRVRVCHITLEMSEERCSQRYLQALFAISKRKEALRTTRFERDKLGRLTGFEDLRVTPSLSFDDPRIRSKLIRKINNDGGRLLSNIVIKQFPTGALTIGHLTAYLDNLETAEQFTPDLLIIDYPDLMKLPADNLRLALDELYQRLRGLAVTRNIALTVVSQSHRAAAKSKQVGAENVAEAYSKIAHCDTVITYSQTEHEQKLGLARLFVAAGRNDESKITIVISQQYGMGSFVLDSALMSNDYWQNVPKSVEDAEDDLP